MTDIIDEALEHYDLKSPACEFIRHNENMTYKVTFGGKAYLLRIHMPAEGFNLDLIRPNADKAELIAGEMELLRRLEGRKGLLLQRTLPNKSGELVTVLSGGSPVTVLEWIEGTTLYEAGVTAETAFEVGAMLGRLHNAARDIEIKNRYQYDGVLASRLLDEAEKARELGHFGERQARVISDALKFIRDYLDGEKHRFEFVHADLGLGNLIVHGGGISPIDFSLCGRSVPEMDIASAFSNMENEALHPDVLMGYKSVSDTVLDEKGLSVCFSLQILLFAVVQHNKFSGEPWFSDALNTWCDKYFAPLLSM